MAASDSVGRMGKFVTRIQPGDKAMWDRMTAEASRLCREKTPSPDAIDALIAIAGSNPRAFGGIGGKSTRSFHRTAEGQQVLRLLVDASIEFAKRTGLDRPPTRHCYVTVRSDYRG